MISHESSSKHQEISKYSLSNRNFEKSKINYSQFRSDFVVKNKNKTYRRQEFKKNIKLGRHVTKFKGNKKNKLYEIFEEEKGENNMSNNIENDFIKKPKRSLKELYNIIKKRFYNKYNKYYTETKMMTYDWGFERPSIYGYYQINNLFYNKKCRIRVYYDEFNCYFNNKENLIDFLRIKQGYNLLRFIIIFLKGNNIYNINTNPNGKCKYKINHFKDFIEIVIEKLNKNLSNKNSILSKIVDNIKEIKDGPNKKESSIINSESFIEVFDYIKINNIFEFDNMEDLANDLNEYVKYLPIFLNIPLIYYNSILPNYCCFGYKINLLIQNYVIKRLNEAKFKKIEKGNSFEKIEPMEESEERTKFIKDKINSYSKLFNDSILKAKGKSFANKENIEDILDNKPIWSFFKKNKKEENRRPLFDHEIIDIQNFVENIRVTNEKKKKAVVSFKVGINKEKKGKDALIKKIMDNNKNEKLNMISNLKNSRNKNKVVGILKPRPKQNSNDNKTTNPNTKYILNYNYKKDTKEQTNDSKSKTSQIIQKRKSTNNSYDKNKSIKFISQYNTKYSYNYTKKYVHSISDTKNSSTNILMNESSNLIKGKNINKLNNIFYNSNIISVSAGLSKKNKFLKKSQSSRIILKKNCNFKDSKEFILQSLRNYKKFNFHRVPLKNIEIFGLNKNLIDFFDAIKHLYNFAHLKSEEVEENEWKKGIFKEQHIKLDYNYNKLMQKIRIQNTRGKRNIYRNVFDKKFNMTDISKRNDIYS